MRVKPRYAVLLTLAILVFPLRSTAETPETIERVKASFLLALGREPSPGELSQWATSGAASVPELMARHQQQLRQDAGRRQAVLERAQQDAWGIPERSGSINTDEALTYTDALQRHLERLGQTPAEYERVIHRAYRRVVGREAYDLELTYWKRYAPLSYALLVGCVEDWARRNQPGLMVTSGTPTIPANSDHLTTLRVSPAIAAEVQAALGLAPSGPERARGRNLLVPGGAEVVTGGRMFLLAVGNAAMTAVARR